MKAKIKISKAYTVLVLFGLILVLPRMAYSTQIKESLDQLRFTELQLSAVTTDMYLYLGWGRDEKEGMKEASLRAVSDLDQLKASVMRYDFPQETSPLKDLALKMIGQITAIYQGIENKDETVVKEQFALFNGFYEEYAERFKRLRERSAAGSETGQEWNPIEEELRWIDGVEEKNRYREATEQIKAKNFAAAYETLKNISEVIPDGPASPLIQLRLSDTLLMMDDGAAITKSPDAAEKGLELLAGILESGRYSPVLYEAFYKWRTIEQQFHHGMSNMSAIPNKEYNEKRRQAIEVVKKHLSENPGDAWARLQLDALWDLPNIQRGGPFGNDNLLHWEMLYGDLKQIE